MRSPVALRYAELREGEEEGDGGEPAGSGGELAGSGGELAGGELASGERR